MEVMSAMRSEYTNGTGSAHMNGGTGFSIELEKWLEKQAFSNEHLKNIRKIFAKEMLYDLEDLLLMDKTTLVEMNMPAGPRKRLQKKIEDYQREQHKKKTTKTVAPNEKEQNATNTPPPFTITYKDVLCAVTQKVLDTEVVVTINSDDLKQSLKQFVKSDNLYNETSEFEAMELLQHLPRFRESDDDLVKSLGQFLDEHFKPLTSKIEKMLAEGNITYNTMWYVFQKDAKIYSFDVQQKLGAIITMSKYVKTCWSQYFQIEAELVKSDGKQIFIAKQQWRITGFDGVKKLVDLPVRPMTNEVLDYLHKRGEKFRDIAIGQHYLQYTGAMVWRTWFGTNQFKADGRVMVDGLSFQRLNPNYDTFSVETAIESLPDSKLFTTFPTLPGFSFSAKKWGEIFVDQVSPVIFDENAYDTLVMPEDKKRLIKALVTNSDQSWSDVISGKGAGCIFLLHGTPGVGKTLTAEAIAELMKRPLYSVSVGELGTNPKELEEKLRNILEVAATWKAVILIDEADIFLRRRTENDIIRNAMVGIFLRLLEYHQGVLFLTTNRVKSFDEAFHSRISVALKYKELDYAARVQIWTNFLHAAGIDSLNPKELAHYELNGRQIRTTIRLAQALATSEKTQLTKQHVETTVAIATQFHLDLQEETPEVNDTDE